MFDEEDTYDEYSEFEYFETSVSESAKFIGWTILLTLLVVGAMIGVAL